MRGVGWNLGFLFVGTRGLAWIGIGGRINAIWRELTSMLSVSDVVFVLCCAAAVADHACSDAISPCRLDLACAASVSWLASRFAPSWN